MKEINTDTQDSTKIVKIGMRLDKDTKKELIHVNTDETEPSTMYHALNIIQVSFLQGTRKGMIKQEEVKKVNRKRVCRRNILTIMVSKPGVKKSNEK